MSPGFKVCATNSSGKICILAETKVIRHITFDGVTRSVKMIPRKQRWYGKLGLYFPGSGNHWKNHNGITRGIINEAQLHFSNKEELLNFLNHYYNESEAVYNDDGLYISWSKSTRPDKKVGGYLRLSIYQIMINGRKPDSLPGSKNDNIVLWEVGDILEGTDSGSPIKGERRGRRGGNSGVAS